MDTGSEKFGIVRKMENSMQKCLSISAVHDEKGKAQNFVALFSDITSAKES
jgi:hypothetical protein